MRKYVLLGCLSFLALGGLYGGIAMIMRPDGSLLQMPLSLLVHSPVTTYTWPGVFLIVCMGLWPAANIYGVLRRTRWARKSNILLGIVTIIWIIYETITIQTYSPLQPIIACIGAAIVYLSYQVDGRNNVPSEKKQLPEE